MAENQSQNQQNQAEGQKKAAPETAPETAPEEKQTSQEQAQGQNQEERTRETAEEQPEEADIEVEDEGDEGGGDLCYLILLGTTVFFEVIDLGTLALNLTGAWLIVGLILDIVRILAIVAIKFSCNGFSFSQLFSSWWQMIVLFLELIPGLDALPWYVLSVLKLNPKKKPPKIEIEK